MQAALHGYLVGSVPAAARVRNRPQGVVVNTAGLAGNSTEPVFAVKQPYGGGSSKNIVSVFGGNSQVPMIQLSSPEWTYYAYWKQAWGLQAEMYSYSGTYLASNNQSVLIGGTHAIQLGALNYGAPTNRAIVAGVSGAATSVACSNLSLVGGIATGTARGGDVIDKTSECRETSDTTSQSLTTRSYHSAKFVNLTESTATTFVNLAVAASKYLGCKLVATVYADDATDFQCLTSELNINAVNKAGTVTTTITQVDGTNAASAGTLTCTYTAVVNGNSVDVKADAASSLVQTTLRIKWSIVSLNTNATDTSAITGSVVTPS